MKCQNWHKNIQNFNRVIIGTQNDNVRLPCESRDRDTWTKRFPQTFQEQIDGPCKSCSRRQRMRENCPFLDMILKPDEDSSRKVAAFHSEHRC